jgi:hypothetical protein
MSDLRELRINNLKSIIKQKQHKVQMPGFKKHDIPEQYAVLYSNRDSPKLFDVLHTVDYECVGPMLKHEIYYSARAYNLDTGELCEERVRTCPCHQK